MSAELGGLGGAAERLEEGSVVLAVQRLVRMIGRQGFLDDRQGALEERLGLGQAAGGPVEHGEVVEADGQVGVLGAQRLLADRKGPLVERLGLGVAAVALMGRSLSEYQLGLLEAAGTRYVTLILDGDEPGRQACAAIMGRLATTPLRVRALMLPEGTQPDTVDEMVLREFLGLS